MFINICFTVMKFLYNNGFRQQFKTWITFQLDMEPQNIKASVNMSSLANQQQGLQMWGKKVSLKTLTYQCMSVCTF